MKAPTAILFLNAEKDMKGGGEFYLRDAVPVAVTSGRTFCGVPQEGGVADVMRALGAEVILIKPVWPRKGRSFLDNYCRLWKAAAGLSAHNIGLVYANGGYLAPFAVRLARLLRARCIVHVHDIFEEEGQDRFLLAKADKVLACSQHVAGMIRGCQGKVEVLYNGVDHHVFTPRIKELPGLRNGLGAKGDFLVGIMGTLNRKKGFFEFVRMAGLLARRIPQMKFVAIGAPKPGEEDVLASLKAAVSEQGLQSRFIWKGFSARPHMDLAALDVLVFPSRYEAFGRVIPEAFACGTPVVATRSGGPEEIIVDGYNGLLKDVDDVSGLAEAVERLYKDRTLRESLVEVAYNDARKRFSLEQMAVNLKRIICSSMAVSVT